MRVKLKIILVENETGYEMLGEDGCHICQLYVPNWQARKGGAKLLPEIRDSLSQVTGLRGNLFKFIVRKRMEGSK